jgi:hypothetical protein
MRTGIIKHMNLLTFRHWSMIVVKKMGTANYYGRSLMLYYFVAKTVDIQR